MFALLDPVVFALYARRDETWREHLAEIVAQLDLRTIQERDYRLVHSRSSGRRSRHREGRADHATYPCLPPITHRGPFGEVMAGMLTEHYEFVGKHSWRIPVFLFRHHEDAEH